MAKVTMDNGAVSVFEREESEQVVGAVRDLTMGIGELLGVMCGKV